MYLIFKLSLILLIITILIIGLSYFQVISKRLAPVINEKQANNDKQAKYLRELYGDMRIAKDVRLYQMVDWFKEISQEITQQYRENLKPKRS